MIHASSHLCQILFLVEIDSLKVLDDLKLNNIVQVESVSLFTRGAVCLVYI